MGIAVLSPSYARYGLLSLPETADAVAVEDKLVRDEHEIGEETGDGFSGGGRQRRVTGEPPDQRVRVQQQAQPLSVPAVQLVGRQGLEKFRSDADLSAHCSEFAFPFRPNRN